MKIARIAPGRARALGSLQDDIGDKVEIARLADIKAGAAPKGAFARTADNFEFKAQATIILLDMDDKGMPESVRQKLDEIGGFESAIESVFPEFANAALVIRPRTSAGIRRRRDDILRERERIKRQTIKHRRLRHHTQAA